VFLRAWLRRTAFLNFDGQSAQDNRNLFGFAFVPPDTNGAVGASQFVQMVKDFSGVAQGINPFLPALRRS